MAGGRAISRAQRHSGVSQGLSDILPGVAGQVTALVSEMQNFVSALNPGLVLQFNQALTVLKATVGTAMQGAFAVFIDMINNISGALMPAMKSLAPIIASFAHILSDLLITQIQTMAVAFEALSPAILLIVNIFEGLVGIIRVVVSVFMAFAKMSGKMDLTDVISNLKTAVASIVRYLIVFGAYFAKAFGLLDQYNKNIGDLLGQKKPGEAGVLPGLQNAQVQGFEEIAKQFATAAAIAAQGGDKEDWMRDAINMGLEDVKGIADGTKDIPSIATDVAEIVKGVKELVQWFTHPIDKAKEVVNKAKADFNDETTEDYEWYDPRSAIRGAGRAYRGAGKVLDALNPFS